MLEVKFSPSTDDHGQTNIACVFLDKNLELPASLMLLDQQHHGIISKTLLDKKSFSGKFAEVKNLTVVNKAGELHNIVLIGCGDETKLTHAKVEELGGKASSIAAALKKESVDFLVPHGFGSISAGDSAALLASGALLANYRFTKHFSKDVEEKASSLKNLFVAAQDNKEAEEKFVELKSVAHGVYLARNLVTEPSNVLYPASYAELVAEKLQPIGVDIEILGEREMHNLGMGALLGVGQGSLNESKVVIMTYNGAENEDEAPIAFVGKGVTFDTGGISLKPAANMEAMKYDMAGSAAVVGAIKALALRSAKVNAVGIVGLVENMPGGNAQKPGDVVTSMSGQTIEIINTDAEGRLVLADILHYVQEKHSPKCIIDLATLTGAVVIALGGSYAGCFSNNDKLADELLDAGKETHELLWRLPLHKDFDDSLKSECADMLNCPNNRGSGSSSVAAAFLQRFVKKDVPWSHLDIAGMAWHAKAHPLAPKGAAGYGVRLLNQLVHKYYESK